MTLFVETTESERLVEWHIGGEKLGDVVMGEFVFTVQADGDELAKILQKVEGIRKVRHQNVVRWTGDDARFIVENL